jgi:lipopolysaccharide/colanic/teichoic acid biosynthesis glycosyltransferase
VLAIALLVLLAPLAAAIAVAVRRTSAGPAIYVQRRVGRDGRIFRCFKFRTMVDGAATIQESLRPFDVVGGPAFKMRRDPRVTPVGRVLRKSSLDEIPQLWNVVRGDMSMVGPRPLSEEDYRRWTEGVDTRTLAVIDLRQSVAPGLTGLWQVSGRSDLSFARWIELDAEYVARRSLLLDARILLRTVPAVLTSRGAY